MKDSRTYTETVHSNRTEALFLVLMLLFLLLSIWHVNFGGLDVLTIALMCLACFFLFYLLNNRALFIRLTPEALELKFGLFTWTVLTANIENCFPDDTSLWRIFGAGIHFSSIRGRYRAMFNFLEHPRVVIALKKKKGLVQDIAFSTCQPTEVLRIIREAMSANTAA
jgi:hypothetical protein